MRVYKFYSARWGLDALYRRRLKVSTEADINDPFEFLAVGKNKAERALARQIRKKMFAENGVISFSKNWSEPLLWSHYAENHSGLALGFDLLPRTGFEVSYPTDRVPLPKDRADEYVFGEGLHFWDTITITKFAAWRYEEEVRIFPPMRGSTHENGLYFWPFQNIGALREIILGAEYKGGKNPELADKLVGEGVAFTTARLSFKNFSVVAQKAKRRHKVL